MAKQIIFMHKSTGNIKFFRTKLEGQLLGKDYTQLQFVKNDKGERVMRANFGKFTMDVMPNGEKVVNKSGNSNTK